MNSVLIGMAWTAGLFVVGVFIGFRLERLPKPYRLGLLSAHIVLFLMISFSIFVAIYNIRGVTEHKFFSTLFLYVAAFTLLANLATGTVMAIKKQKDSKLILAHKVATIFMAISIVASIAFMVFRL